MLAGMAVEAVEAVEALAKNDRILAKTARAACVWLRQDKTRSWSAARERWAISEIG